MNKLRSTLAQIAFAAAAAVAAITSMPAHAHGGGEDQINLAKMLAAARKATEPFTDLKAALSAGYTKFPDQSGDCVDSPGNGGMGVHYLNGTLISDAVLDPLHPEFLVYQEGHDGKRQLVALEYVVFAPMWDAVNPQPPTLFGHPLHLVRTPNRYGTTDPFYELHVWLWEHNANGLFNDWNPSFNCH